MSSITNTGGTTTDFEYDANNRVTKVTRVNPAGTDAVTRLVYSSSPQTLVADPDTDPNVAVGIGTHTTYTLDGSELVTNANGAPQLLCGALIRVAALG